jgi:non-heme chloroperoxidase
MTETTSPNARMHLSLFREAEAMTFNTERSSRLVTRGPVSLYAETYGDPGASRRVLCIHGAWQSLECFRRCATWLSHDDCYVVLWDLPFHGLSGPFEEKPVTAGLWADSVQAMIEEFDLHEVVLLAWSFGAIVVADYLRRAGPSGIAGLILVGTALLEPQAEETWMQALYETHPAMAAVSSPERLARITAVPYFYRLLSASPLEASVRYQVTLAMHMAAWRSGPAFQEGRVPSAPLPDLTLLPVLSLSGQHDPCFPPDVIQATSIVCPQTHSVLLPCGHTPMLECPHLFQHHVQRFLHQ